MAGILDSRFYGDLLRDLLPRRIPVRAADPGDIEIVPARDADRAVYFVLNHDRVTRTVTLDGTWHDLLSGAEHSGHCELTPYGVCVLAALPELRS